MAFTMSSLTRRPAEISSDACWPSGEPDLISARNISPVDIAGIFSRSVINGDCVPLPLPGGPKSKMTNDPSRAYIVAYRKRPGAGTERCHYVMLKVPMFLKI